jgi:hypothetical protein
MISYEDLNIKHSLLNPHYDRIMDLAHQQFELKDLIFLLPSKVAAKPQYFFHKGLLVFQGFPIQVPRGCDAIVNMLRPLLFIVPILIFYLSMSVV